MEGYWDSTMVQSIYWLSYHVIFGQRHDFCSYFWLSFSLLSLPLSFLHDMDPDSRHSNSNMGISQLSAWLALAFGISGTVRMG